MHAVCTDASPPLTTAFSHMCVQAELLAELEGDMFDLRDQLTQAAGMMAAGGLLWVLPCPVCAGHGPCRVPSMRIFEITLKLACMLPVFIPSSSGV